MNSWIELDAEALRRNYLQLVKASGSAKLAAVVKANAYGHGLEEITRILMPLKPEVLCVNSVFEAAQLRKCGFNGRVIVVGPIFPEDLHSANREDAEVFLGNLLLLKAWLDISEAFRPKIHLKFDTGLSRQGFSNQELGNILLLLESKSAVPSGVCTHFANVEDVSNYAFAQKQLNDFEPLVARLREKYSDLLIHAASSASTLILPESRFDLCRVGISLYGFWPSPLTRLSYLSVNHSLLDLQPVLGIKTQIANIKTIAKGVFVGYGCTFKSSKEMVIGVVPFGYYEGFPRLAGEQNCHVLVRGQRAPLVGRVSMNMMTVDLTNIPDAMVGDQVTIVGKDGGEIIHCEDIANWARTIQYEIVTGLHPSLPRRIINE